MVTNLVAAITGNVSDQEMTATRGDRPFYGGGIEAGGRIVLGPETPAATTADVVVTDGRGRVLYTGTVIANTNIDPVPCGIAGPLTVTVTNISNASHHLTVYWSIKE